MPKSRKRKKRNAGVLIAAVGVAVFLTFFALNALGIEIDNPFVPHVIAEVTITPFCGNIPVLCDIDSQHTTVSFERITPPSLLYVPCFGMFFGAEIFERFEVREAGYEKMITGIRLCKDPVIQRFKFPLVPGKNCYDWKLTVGYFDENGNQITYYIKQGRYCSG
nr:hypothetical protein 23 [bacterium]